MPDSSVDPTTLVPSFAKALESRRWCLRIVESPEDLAACVLVEQHPCAAFTVVGHAWYAFLNNSTDEHAKHYVVVRTPQSNTAVMHVIDEVNFGKMSRDEAVAHLKETLSGADDAPILAVGPLRLENPWEHGDCSFCG